MVSDRIRWPTTRAVFEEAVAAHPDGRAGVLDARCGDDIELRRDVEALLAAHDRAGSFLDVPLACIDAPATSAQSLWIGRRVGAYRIVREIGRGGMGHVFLAERADALFEKQVAIKIVRLTADADLLVERFRRERQILATLEHPNITRMLDAGVTDDNVPFVVMEFVDGVPIDEYCERHQLDLRRRLELVVDVCVAVHAAHTCAIVHRDLKPANILVTVDGVPKLLDFGIAKMVEAPLDGQLTQTSERVLTPLTAAPEQLSGGLTTVTTDVYALGSLLYRLITGVYPFADAESNAALECAIQHTPPRSPSQVTAPPRGVVVPASAARELDYIVLKALKKDPAKRYPSAEALAADLRRHIEGHPVADVQDLRRERLRAFVGRHATWFAAAVAAMTLVTAAFVWRAGQSSAARSAAAIDTMSHVAIQPFRELNAADVDSRLGWGMADALLTRLGRVSGLGVRVIAPDILESSDEPSSRTRAATASMAADFRIDGTIQRSGGRVRVTARLLDGRSGATMWNTMVEDTATRLFELQDRLSVDIVRRLSPRFDRTGLRARSATGNERAYEAYVQGRYHLSLGRTDAVLRALYYFEQAASEDPSFAAAHAGVAVTYAWLREASPLTPPDQSARGRAAARRALAVEDLGEAHAALGVFTLVDDWDWQAAEEAFKRALTLNPNDSMVVLWYAAGLTAHSRFSEALEHLRRAQARDPYERPLQNQLVRVLYMARQFDETLRECERMAADDPTFAMWPCALAKVQRGGVEDGVAELEAIVRTSRRAPILAALGYSYGRAGRTDAAQKVIGELAQVPESEGGIAYYTAEVRAGLGDRAGTLAALERARKERYPAVLLRVAVDVKFDLLTAEERARLVTPPAE